MPNQTSFSWFVPAPYGDEDPSAPLSNRLMNRIDIALMILVVICIGWNAFGLRQVRSITMTLAEANAFFFRPATIALWIATGLSIIWLVGRFVLTSETRFVLFYEGAILFLAILTPLLIQELSGFSINRGPGEVNLVAFACRGTAPPEGAGVNRSECHGFPIEETTVALAAGNPREHADQNLIRPDEFGGNTAQWRRLSTGEYAFFLVMDAPEVSCADGVPNVRVLERDVSVSCEENRVILALHFPDDARNLQIAIYEADTE